MFKVNYAGFNVSEENFTSIFRPNGSGDYLFIYFLAPMQVAVDEDFPEVDAGSCILYAPGAMQEFSAVRDFRISFVHFSADKKEMDAFGLPYNTVFYPEKAMDINSSLSDIQSEFFTKNLFNDLMLDICVKKLLISLAREKHEKDADALLMRKNLYNLFCQARYTMLSNCEREWSSTNMSEMVSLSRSQYYKYYNDFFGISPMADLQNARIEKAKNLLLNANNQVTDVAHMCGYTSIYHFSRTFREHVGMSPVAFVKQQTGANF